MGNPFEDESGEFSVLMNSEGQYSLWPVFKEVPAGWTAVITKAARQECLAYIEKHWTDMRPTSLIEQMNSAATGSVTTH